ncbi:MAG: helix-turn-helix transcriptional regulator, partial [Clostridia bacterium]|nr:helix-turn-helix transcriptional regulator [Clostridia bacterium]
MDNYVTGKIIKDLREKLKMTQAVLAEKIGVSDKAVSKWETGKGLPDITLIEPLASALKVSVIELMNGEHIVNCNKACNMKKACFSVCPICGNVIVSVGESVKSCCGVSLPHLEAEKAEGEHEIDLEISENEYYVSMRHEMNKCHYISF